MMITEEEISEIVRNQRVFFNTRVTLPYEFRIIQLKKLRNGIKKYEKEFTIALKSDLGKSKFEAYATEIGFTLHDISYSIKNLKKWMKPKKVSTPVMLQPASSRIESSPLGVNLIIAPFNYPVQLALAPLVAAIAAGNTAVIKTSELTPACSEVIKNLIEDIFSSIYIAYIPGEIPETTALLKQKFDHIFFTGSPRVGSIVMEAAAKYITPVTLELGGKSPCIVHSDAKIDIAVNRIVYGKFMNAGQTCVAPDYVMVHKEVKEVFLAKIKKRIIKLYGTDATKSKDYGRIINEQHLIRIAKHIDKHKLVVGGTIDKSINYISPTVMKNVEITDSIMSEEIFGPILPVLEYENFTEIYDVIGKLSHHPLACYIFSESKKIQEDLVSKIQFGGGCINHCIQHLVNPNLPFGGVGNSGMGSYHGYEGFKQFSHQKSILKAATWLDPSIIYSPFNLFKLKLLKMLLK